MRGAATRSFIHEDNEYFEKLLREFKMETCEEARSPTSPSTSTSPQAVGDATDKERYGLFRRAVGQLPMACMPLPAHRLHNQRTGKVPEWATGEEFKRLTHLLRYVNGTLQYTMALRPSTTLPADKNAGYRSSSVHGR